MHCFGTESCYKFKMSIVCVKGVETTATAVMDTNIMVEKKVS